jgi:hypothetical protein
MGPDDDNEWRYLGIECGLGAGLHARDDNGADSSGEAGTTRVMLPMPARQSSVLLSSLDTSSLDELSCGFFVHAAAGRWASRSC